MHTHLDCLILLGEFEDVLYLAHAHKLMVYVMVVMLDN